jgi:hypothetical protein
MIHNWKIRGVQTTAGTGVCTRGLDVRTRDGVRLGCTIYEEVEPTIGLDG